MVYPDRASKEPDIFMCDNNENDTSASLVEIMEVEIAVDKYFHAYLFHSAALCAEIQYAIYDIAKGGMALVTDTGEQREVGLKISPHIHGYLQYAQEVRLLEMKGDILFRTTDIPLLIQK